MNINCKSDFKIKVTPTVGGTPVDITGHDFRLVFTTTGGSRRFTASQRDGVLENCYIEGTAIVVTLDNHCLPTGRLWVRVYDYAPDVTYPDGNELTVTPQQLDVTLVSGAGDGSAVDAQVSVDIGEAVSAAREAADAAGASADIARAAQVAAEAAAERAEQVGGYTKAEANALLAGKANVNGDRTKSFSANGYYIGNLALLTSVGNRVVINKNDGFVYFPTNAGTLALTSDIPDISGKADRRTVSHLDERLQNVSDDLDNRLQNVESNEWDFYELWCDGNIDEQDFSMQINLPEGVDTPRSNVETFMCRGTEAFVQGVYDYIKESGWEDMSPFFTRHKQNAKKVHKAPFAIQFHRRLIPYNAQYGHAYYAGFWGSGSFNKSQYYYAVMRFSTKSTTYDINKLGVECFDLTESERSDKCMFTKGYTVDVERGVIEFDYNPVAHAYFALIKLQLHRGYKDFRRLAVGVNAEGRLTLMPMPQPNDAIAETPKAGMFRYDNRCISCSRKIEVQVWKYKRQRIGANIGRHKWGWASWFAPRYNGCKKRKVSVLIGKYEVVCPKYYCKRGGVMLPRFYFRARYNNGKRKGPWAYFLYYKKIIREVDWA